MTVYPLADAPTRTEGGVVYRTCTHGGTHVDPEDEAHRCRGVTMSRWSWIGIPHGTCCEHLCCVGEPTEADRVAVDAVAVSAMREGAHVTDEGRAAILRRVVAARLADEAEEADEADDV